MPTTFQTRAWAFALHLASIGEVTLSMPDSAWPGDEVDDWHRSSAKRKTYGYHATGLRFDSHWFSDATYPAVITTADAMDADLNGWDRVLHGTDGTDPVPSYYGFRAGDDLDWAGWTALCLNPHAESGSATRHLRISTATRPGPARPGTATSVYGAVLAGVTLIVRDLHPDEWPTAVPPIDAVALAITGLARAQGVIRRPAWFDPTTVAAGLVAYARALREAAETVPYTSTWSDGTTYESKRIVHADTHFAPGTAPEGVIDLLRAVGNASNRDRAFVASHVVQTGEVEAARAWTSLTA